MCDSFFIIVLKFRRYETELRSPITSIVFGDLMQEILIQMQKLKARNMLLDKFPFALHAAVKSWLCVL